MHYALDFAVKNNIKNWFDLEFDKLFNYLCKYKGLREPNKIEYFEF